MFIYSQLITRFVKKNVFAEFNWFVSVMLQMSR